MSWPAALLLSCAALAGAPEDPAPTPPAPARPYALLVGDPAPALAPTSWLAGEDVPRLGEGKVTIVEFWATWCAPCVRSMPHLSALADEWREEGLRVVGVTSADDRGNTLEAVRAMIAAKQDVLRYSVAWDEARAVNAAWMAAAGRTTIPSAFLVDRAGRIAWIGNPAEIDDVLARVMRDEFDLPAAAAAYLLEKRDERRRAELRNVVAAIQKRILAAQREGDVAAMIAGYDEILALDPSLGDFALQKFNVLLTVARDAPAAYAFALDALERHVADRPDTLVRMAQLVLDGRDVAVRDHGVALALALRADEIRGGRDAFAADTLAKAWYANGDLEQAVLAEQRAVAYGPEAVRQQYRVALARYERLLAEERAR